ncbi:Com family DNA-binding transcriptional regulator [Paralysiella testudinis]|uniref:Com family DNA-binding transcriptional regulator n=1 Tax=Paralysiella testudinis TaxID=2809020 RepID=A0A892ZK31_9NEIS|nr:Com family DNA-binding transcriptional regulator [Paralysiella testudinis]QRQ82056.1 Com family DNA-binding transcriptional regulator [Paralysiella testudinis]
MKHRCKNCNKLLAEGCGTFEIKCPRCKAINRLSSLTTQHAAITTSPKISYIASRIIGYICLLQSVNRWTQHNSAGRQYPAIPVQRFTTNKKTCLCSAGFETLLHSVKQNKVAFILQKHHHLSRPASRCPAC